MLLILGLIINLAFSFVWNHEYQITLLITKNLPQIEPEQGQDITWGQIAGYKEFLMQKDQQKVFVIHLGDMEEKSIFSSILNFEPDYKNIGLIKYDSMLLGPSEASYFKKDLSERQDWSGRNFVVSNLIPKEKKWIDQLFEKKYFFNEFDKLIHQDLSIAVLNYLDSKTRQDKFIKEIGLEILPAESSYQNFSKKFLNRFDMQILFLNEPIHKNWKINWDHTIVVSSQNNHPHVIKEPEDATEILQVDLGFINGTISKRKITKLKQMDLKKYHHQQISAQMKVYQKRLDKILNEKVGDIVSDFNFNFENEGKDKNFWGRTILKAYQRFFKANIAFTDYGNLSDFPTKGALYYRDIFKMYNQKNELCTVSILGRELQDYLSYMTFKFPSNNSRKPIGTGFKFAQADDQENYLLVGDKFLRQQKVYKMILPRTMLVGDEYFPALDVKNKFECSSLKEHQVLSYYLKSIGQI
jgi:2',3'-cyclic-nucleotide 2'-phosphodiesterase (5'-nucleotidase family)